MVEEKPDPDLIPKSVLFLVCMWPPGRLVREKTIGAGLLKASATTGVHL